MEEITVEEIKERIKENLRKEINHDLTIKTHESFMKPESFIGHNYGESMKKKFIAFGLKHKPLIKKIPVVGTVARQFYHAIVNKSIFQNRGSDISKIKQIIKIVRGIPLVGYLVWWIYIILKTPPKINQLFSEVDRLRSRCETLESRIITSVSERLKPTCQRIDSPSGIMNRTIKSLNDIIPEIIFLDNLNACFHPTFYKNWDMGLFMRFILNHFDNTAWILDVGCTSNPLLFNLADKGYLNLNGIDLHLPQENIYIHPQIRYIEADLMQTPFEDCQFDCITSLSVIEHGVDPESYFKEMSRILKSGGVLLTSTDYWPEKIQTQDVLHSMTFGLPWNIFSEREIKELINISERHGFKLLTPLEYTTIEPVVHYLGKAYTFIVFGLEKRGT